MKKARAATTKDWLQLPEDTLYKIVRRLDHFPTDHAQFGRVCKLWRSVAKPNRCHLQYKKLPGLMVPGIERNSLTRRYFSLLNHEESVLFEEDANSNKLEVPHVCVCRGSSYGWLLLVGNGLNTKLFNPFTSAEIQLPPVATLPSPLLLPREFDHQDKWYVKKTVFSSNPSCFQQRSLVPLVILVIYGDTRRLAYCKPGDKAWTALEFYGKENGFMDAIYYNDRFLALGSNKEIMALDIGTSSRSSSTHTDDNNCEVLKVTQYACIPASQYLEHTPTFLVELQGDLVALTQKFRNPYNQDDDKYDKFEATDYRGASRYGDCRTAEFRMLRFETNKQQWVEVKSLGNNVLFLGYNTSFSLRTATDYLGCIPDSIYFTNNISETNWYDMGIYNLKDKSINRLYRINDSQPNYPCPIWVERDPWLD